MLQILGSMQVAWNTLLALPKKTLQESFPEAKSYVRGFEVSLERRKGCMLKSRPKDAPKGTPYIDASVDEYFEVIVDYDGSNNSYPDVEKGKRSVAFLTNSLKGDSGYGMVRGVHYYPLGVRYTKVQIEEKYEDWIGAEVVGSGRPKAGYYVWLSIYTTKRDGPLRIGID